MRAIYRPLSLNRAPVVEMSRRGAELTKYAGNAFLATKITFINEIADLCEKVAADVQEVARVEQAQLVLDGVTNWDSPYEAIDGADGLAIVTEWDAFRALDLKRVRSMLKQPVLVDLRNIYPPAEVEAAGLRYVGVGR
jgi:UDPglucose 6-dehydrogenase